MDTKSEIGVSHLEEKKKECGGRVYILLVWVYEGLKK